MHTMHAWLTVQTNDPRVLLRLNQDAMDDISCSWQPSQGDEDMGQAGATESLGATAHDVQP